MLTHTGCRAYLCLRAALCIFTEAHTVHCLHWHRVGSVLLHQVYEAMDVWQSTFLHPFPLEKHLLRLGLLIGP